MSLTDEQIKSAWDASYPAVPRFHSFARAIESAATAPLLERIAELEKALKLVQQHHATAWNRGHLAGMAANRMVARDAMKAVEHDAWNNTQLTEALMAAEKRSEELERELAAAKSELSRPMSSEATLIVHDNARLRRELEAVRKDAGWRPIETAPDTMNGTVVVRWADSDGYECRVLDYKEDGCWIGWHEHAENVEIIGGHGVSYTPPYAHWMPLPPAPDAAKEHP